MTTMLAARATDSAAPLTLDTVPVPTPGPQDVLIKVAAAGLAPSIMKLLRNGAFRHLPTTPGHEAAGTVVAAGPEADQSLIGRRVRMHATLTCRSCEYCRTDREQMCAEAAMVGHAAFGRGRLTLYERYHDGGLAEYVKVPDWMVDPLPDGVSFDVGAKVHDLANAVRALRLTEVPLGGTLAITAATGTMGTATLKLASFFGVGRVVLIGRSKDRLDALRDLSGIPPCETIVLGDGDLTTQLRDLVPGGLDAVTDYLPGGDAGPRTLPALADGGTFVHMGGSSEPLPYPLRRMMHDCWRVIGTRNCTRNDTAAVLRLLGSGALDAEELVTHRFPLSRLSSALATLETRSEPIWMGVVHP